MDAISFIFPTLILIINGFIFYYLPYSVRGRREVARGINYKFKNMSLYINNLNNI
jgi:hypothetical protein